MKVLLSINPEHVENIFKGVKTFEFRRKVFSRKDVTTVVVYCTMPVGKIVGEFDIDTILMDAPEEIWRKTRTGSGISRDFFDQYFSGRDVAYALKIGEVREYDQYVDPKEVLDNFTPPQSYMYMREERRKDKRREQLELW
jgi:predicted transcriptional regulator